MINNIETIKACCAGIYKITYENGKIYIGQSQNVKKRLQEHNQRANKKGEKLKYPSDLALAKYDAFAEILEIVTDLNQLDEKETYWINYYNTTQKEKGYNLIKEGNASGKRGCDNLNAAFTHEELNEIINLLIFNTELSYKDIAENYNVSSDTIYRISCGQNYYNPNLNYPLRKNNHESQKKQFNDFFDSEKELINLKEDLKYSWYLSIEQDLVNKYNIPLKRLRDINNGRLFPEIGNYDYPIRKKNIRNIHNLTKENILDILSLLKNTNDSMINIGKKFNLSRDTIAKINKGESYIIKNYNYPARLTK